jgi:hypothetical protein
MPDWSELDHVMIFCDPEAPEAAALLERGLHEGPRNSHPGQGTTNRRFFFRNVYLELIWVENFAEVQSAGVLPTGLWNRWNRRAEGVCPIGLVFRPGRRALSRTIESWTYRPSYFPEGFSIEVASGIPDHEPLLIYLPYAKPSLVEEADPAAEALVGAVLDAVLHLPLTGAMSPALGALVSAGVISVEPSRQFSIDLRQVGGSSEIIDFRPRLPVRIVPARSRDALLNIPPTRN